MPTLIYPPSIPWSWMFQRPQQILRQLSMIGYTVLFEDLGHFATTQVKPLSSHFLLCQGVSPLTLPHDRPRFLWLTVPSQIGLSQEYKPDLIIYDAVDEPKDEFSSWAPYYPEVLAKADIIFASGQSIFEELSKSHPNVHLVPNGVDYPHFSNRALPRPSDLPRDKRIAGYSGAIAPWLDWDLLRVTIRENPDVHFIFLGALFQMRQFPLKFPNVKYLGLKPYSKLPAYLQYFDIGLIPFKLTEMTKGCNPIKLYEYYAAGLQVLGTPLPELLTIPKIYLEHDPIRFAKRLRQLLHDGDLWVEERLAFAQANDWANRALTIHKKIQTTLTVKFSSL